MQIQGINKMERRERVNAMLNEVGLAGKEKRFPAQLSGGQNQRVAIARAMASKPDIILADEPTANLDSTTGIELVEMMTTLNERHHTTFLFSTHDPIIMERARRVITLHDGEIQSDTRG
jgi:putative ABC transport system ATP-binding protein